LPPEPETQIPRFARNDNSGDGSGSEGEQGVGSQELRTDNRKLRTDSRTENREPATGLRITFDALGWHMAERLEKSPLLAGDSLDIAFTIGHNDHLDYGGLELTLRDFRPRSA
jgi:hypothetical protein